MTKVHEWTQGNMMAAAGRYSNREINLAHYVIVHTASFTLGLVLAAARKVA